MTDDALALGTRKALPDALRVLANALPRSGWEADPNFDGLTRFWLGSNFIFRNVLNMLRNDAQHRLDGEMSPERHLRETERSAGFLLNQLHGHHRIEDQHYLPQLVGRDAWLGRGFTLLDAGHNALDGHIHAMAETANTYLRANERDAVRNSLGALHRALAAFERFLDRHLTDEEDLVVPVILTYAPNLR
ncbi:MAG: hemerythrin domain-containing protein [Pseudomonadota bacterium]